MITNTQKVARDISQAPYYDAEYKKILPGQLVLINEYDPIIGVIQVVGEDLCFDETPLDAILEVTDNLYVVGWVQ